MQQLTIEHKSNNQKIVSEKQTKEVKDRRESKGRILAISRRIYRLENSDVFYVESETSDNVYYYVKYNPDVFEICSCPDSWTRHVKCKHLFAIQYAIMKGTLKYIDKLPAEAKRFGSSTEAISPKSYKDDDYDF